MTEPEIMPPEQPAGRPKEFVQEIFDEVCDRMAGGQGLRKICEDPQMPSRPRGADGLVRGRDFGDRLG